MNYPFVCWRTRLTSTFYLERLPTIRLDKIHTDEYIHLTDSRQTRTLLWDTWAGVFVIYKYFFLGSEAWQYRFVADPIQWILNRIMISIDATNADKCIILLCISCRYRKTFSIRQRKIRPRRHCAALLYIVCFWRMKRKKNPERAKALNEKEKKKKSYVEKTLLKGVVNKFCKITPNPANGTVVFSERHRVKCTCKECVCVCMDERAYMFLFTIFPKFLKKLSRFLNIDYYYLHPTSTTENFTTTDDSFSVTH